jgi:hypothetical protein
MGKLYRTRGCDCEAEMWPGQERPDRCEAHGNRYQTEAELAPRKRTPLRPVSLKRQAEEAAGTREKQRGNGLNPGKGFEASPAQRKKVRGMPCLGCSRNESFAIGEGVFVVDPAHLWPRGKGGCDHPDCVIPLCRTCHRAFDKGELDLLERMADSEAWAVEQAHPILCHGVTLVELVRRLAGNRQELVWVEREAVAR